MTRRQLLAVAIASIIIALAAAMAIDRTSSRQQQEQLTQQLRRETAMIEHWLSAGGDQLSLQGAVDQGAKELLLRITLMDAAGSVLADSKSATDGITSAGLPVELRLAADIGVGESVRPVEPEGRDYLFSARLTTLHPMVRYIRVGIRADGPPYFNRRHRFTLFTSCLLIGLAPLALAFWFLRSQRSQLRTATRLISSPQLKVSDEAEPLSEEMAVFTRHVRERERSLREELAEVEQRMSGLSVAVSAMREGLLVVDQELRLRLVNASARRLLGLSDDDLDRSIEQIIRNPTLIDALTKTVRFGDSPPTSNLSLGDLERTFQLRVTPLTGEDGSVHGALALFFDITKLITLERVRRDFVANVSHELRTPLTAIKAAVETLQDDPNGSAGLRQTFTSMIGRNAAAMEGLVEDLTDLTLVETGAVRLERLPFNLTELVRDVAEQLRPVLASTAIEFELPNHLPVVGDPRRVRQIVVNLLENALKFNRDEAPISLGGETVEDEVLLHVIDRGIGIPATDLENIFNRFYQVADDRSRSGTQRGSGLGLAIVKHLARRHGGSIDVRSELGVGSTFTLRLPRDDDADS
jgi:two-component system phosphate regulon sensor histidine kinase PhoR